jgi:hypothetical protein
MLTQLYWTIRSQEKIVPRRSSQRICMCKAWYILSVNRNFCDICLTRKGYRTTGGRKGAVLKEIPVVWPGHSYGYRRRSSVTLPGVGHVRIVMKRVIPILHYKKYSSSANHRNRKLLRTRAGLPRTQEFLQASRILKIMRAAQ